MLEGYTGSYTCLFNRCSAQALGDCVTITPGSLLLVMFELIDILMNTTVILLWISDHFIFVLCVWRDVFRVLIF